MEAKRLLTPVEAARELGIPRNRAYEWIRAGYLPAVRDRGRIYVARAAVDRLVEHIAQGRWPDAPFQERPT